MSFFILLYFSLLYITLNTYLLTYLRTYLLTYLLTHENAFMSIVINFVELLWSLIASHRQYKLKTLKSLEFSLLANRVVLIDSLMSLVVRKPVFGVSDQVPHKPGCAITEYG